jgi:hypothetical protein
MSRRRTPLLVAVLALVMPAAAARGQTPGLPPLPIPGPTLSQSDSFEGHPATPWPVTNASEPPRHPHMAPNGRSNIHDDAYMTDTYRVSGPLGTGTAVASNFFARECASVAFDSAGRLVTVCVGLDRPVLAMLEPGTLRVLATMPLPPRDPSSAGGIFTDFSGGGYFFLDDSDRAVLPTTNGHVLVVGEAGTATAPSFQVEADYDLSAAVAGAGGIVSVLPEWSGRLWFVTRGGLVGTIDPSDGTVKTLALAGEGISNSFSVDETGGAFIVSDKALYRFDAGPSGEPQVSWREAYPSSGTHKPGQSDAGSGTTPTLMGSRWVSITDNADPMDVVIYRRSRTLAGGLRREICRQPVFGQGAGATDQSLIGTDSAVVAENNYGYSGPAATEFGGVTQPGLARVDITVRQVGQAVPQAKKKAKKRKRRHRRHHGKRGKKARHRKHGKHHKPGSSPSPAYEIGCRTIWTSQERAPSVVPKLSLANGLVYTYTKPPRPDNVDAWYLTTLDFRSGETVFRRLAGVGLGFNNNYAPVTLGPDGTAYVGVLGGLVSFQDTGA